MLHVFSAGSCPGGEGAVDLFEIPVGATGGGAGAAQSEGQGEGEVGFGKIFFPTR